MKQTRGNTYENRGTGFKNYGKVVDLSDLKARIKEINQLTPGSEVSTGDRVMHKNLEKE